MLREQWSIRVICSTEAKDLKSRGQNDPESHCTVTHNAIAVAQQSGDLPNFEIPQVTIERPQKEEWGDYSSSLPLKLTSAAKRAPLQIAQIIAKHIPADPA